MASQDWMNRIILSQRADIGNEIVIEGPPLEALWFQGVRVGSLVTLTDARGRDLRGRVRSLSRERASVLIFGAFSASTESAAEIILLQALPERERMELIIQKATELGVSAIVPFKAERSISLEEREARQKKVHRWQEIAVRAVRQSRRARVPRVEGYRSFKDALEVCQDGLKIMLWEKEGQSLRDVLRQFSFCHCERPEGEWPSPPFSGRCEMASVVSLPRHDICDTVSRKGGQICAMVGPEGGFTDEEVGFAQEKGFIPVKLGQRILRTETAAIVLVGLLQYELGDLG